MKSRWATFDCYGTLIDWERGIKDTLSGLWPNADPAELLALYHRIEPEVEDGSGRPYREVLAEVLTKIAEEKGLKVDDPDILSASLPEWPPFGEVADELRELRKHGWRLAILSNSDPELLDASIKRIGVDIDKRITVAEAGSYKPAPGHWEAFFASTEADPAGHAHVAASLFHDIAPATDLGLRAVWINRNDEETELQPAPSCRRSSASRTSWTNWWHRDRTVTDIYDPDDSDPFVVVWEGPTIDAQMLRMQIEESHIPVELGDVPTPGEARVMVPRSYLAEVRDVIQGTQARWPSPIVDTESGLDVDPRIRLAFVVVAALVLIVLVITAVT